MFFLWPPDLGYLVVKNKFGLIKPILAIHWHFKGSSDPSYFIFEINDGKSRIRHTTTLKLNDELLNRLKIDGRERPVVQIQSCSMSDPLLSDIDLINKVIWV